MLRSHEDFGKRAHLYLTHPEGWEDFFAYLAKAFGKALETGDFSHIATYFFSLEYLLVGRGHFYYQVGPELQQRTARFLIEELENIYRLTGQAHRKSSLVRAQGLALLVNFLPQALIQKERFSAKEVLPIYLLCGHTLFEAEFYAEENPRALRLARKGLFIWWAEDLLSYLSKEKLNVERDKALKEKLRDLARKIAGEIKEDRVDLEAFLWILLSDFFWEVHLGAEVDLKKVLQQKGEALWPRLSTLCRHYLGEEGVVHRFRTFIEERVLKSPRPGQAPTGGEALPLEFPGSKIFL